MTRDDTRCPRFAPGLSLGRVQAPTLTEISGLVVSKKNSDVLWVHNDSGNAAELIALNTKGRTVAQFALPSAENVDWEDMAQGPGPSPHESYLFIGDIGGNRTPRHRIVLYRVVEPDLGAVQRSIWHEALAATPLTLEYPGAEFHDAEAIFFDPRSAGDLYVVTKDRHGASRVYRARPAPRRASNDARVRAAASISAHGRARQ